MIEGQKHWGRGSSKTYADWRILSIPLGPSVVFTKSPTAIAPTNAERPVGGHQVRWMMLDFGGAGPAAHTSILSPLLRGSFAEDLCRVFLIKV